VQSTKRGGKKRWFLTKPMQRNKGGRGRIKLNEKGDSPGEVEEYQNRRNQNIANSEPKRIELGTTVLRGYSGTGHCKKRQEGPQQGELIKLQVSVQNTKLSQPKKKGVTTKSTKHNTVGGN